MLWRTYSIFQQLIIFQDKCISVSSAHIDFGHHMPHNRSLLPFITTLYSLRKMCFDTNVGYVCHMTIFFVAMFVFIGSVSYVVWFSRFIYMYIYTYISRERKHLHHIVCIIFSFVFYVVQFHHCCYLYTWQWCKHRHNMFAIKNKQSLYNTVGTL